MSTPEQTAELKAETIAEKVANDLVALSLIRPSCIGPVAGAIKRNRELNLAELVKCKDRCEALDEGMRIPLNELNLSAAKNALVELGMELGKTQSERDSLRAKVQELELTIKNLQAH